MRGSSYVVGALVLALVAAGILVSTDLIKLPWLDSPSSTPGDLPSLVGVPTSSSPESRLVAPMNEAAAAGGFAASFSEREGRTWELTRGHRLERFALNGGTTVFARLSSGAALDKSQVIDGLFVELPLEFTRLSAGKRIEVGVVARAAQTNPSNEFSVLYATRQAGNSGWRTFQLASNFELRTFAFDVPAALDGYSAKPVIVVRGDPLGRGLGLELIGVYAKVMSPATAANASGARFRVDFSPMNSAEWMVPEGHSLSVVRDPQGGVSLGRLTSARPLQPQELKLGSQGPSVFVPATIARQLNGKKVNIVVRARAAAANPSDRLRIVFATQKAGHTGWLSVPLTPQLESHSFSYTIPKVPDGYTDPFLVVIHAENNGSEQSADVESVDIVAAELN